MSTPEQPSEEELRAAYEAQLKQLRVEDVVLQTDVSLINLGGRKAGLAPDSEDERDLDQLKMAVDGVRALLPLIEAQLGPDATQLKDAVSQLQMAYVRLGGSAPEGGGAPSAPEPPAPPAGPGGGRLWVPGQ
jgi:hypothetical protein